MTDDYTDDWKLNIDTVAVWTASDFPDISPVDIATELVDFVFGREIHLSDPTTDGALRRLEQEADRIARGIRAGQLYTTPQYTYRGTDVDRLLEYLFDYDSWSDAPVPEDAHSFENRCVDHVEVMADVSWAYSKLEQRHRTELWFRYALNIEPERGSQEMKQLRQARRALMEVLNGYSP